MSRFKPKDTVDQWTDVHEAAHRVGFKTTATMMYGHVEKDHHIIESLEHIRVVQDLALKNGNDGGKKGRQVLFVEEKWKRRWKEGVLFLVEKWKRRVVKYYFWSRNGND